MLPLSSMPFFVLAFSSFRYTHKYMPEEIYFKYSYSFKTGRMSISQRRGVIASIPKKNAISPFPLKNWRLICLPKTPTIKSLHDALLPV